MPQGNEANLLSGEFHAYLCLLLSEFGELDACVDGSTGVNHLLCLEGKVVAEMWRFQAVNVAEVAVGNQRIADVAEREGSIKVGQFLAFSRFDAEMGCFYS